MKLYDKQTSAWTDYILATKHPGARFSTLAHNLEIIDQRGPTCGLHALAAILRAKGVYVKATEGVAYPYNDTGPSLRQLAKVKESVISGKKISQIGELFNAEDVKPLAQEALLNILPGPTVSVSHHTINTTKFTDDFIKILKDAIDTDKLIMVPFVVDDVAPNEGYPFANNPKSVNYDENAHWCIVLGYQESSGIVSHFLTAHWGKVYPFDANEFAQSNMNIGDFPESYWCKKGIDIAYSKCITTPKNSTSCTNITPANICSSGKIIDSAGATKLLNQVTSCVHIQQASLSTTLARQVVVIG